MLAVPCASVSGCKAVTVSGATSYTPSQATGLTGSGDANPPVLANQISIWNGTTYTT